MSKELADKLEQLADDLHSQAMIDADEVLIMRESIAALRSEPVAINEKTVEWVVNDIAELGVKIGNQFFWLYKGHSLQYGKDGDTVKTGIVQHDEGGAMHWRPVGKREFGECCNPVNYKNPHLIGTVSLTDSDEWMPLPAAPSRETDQRESNSNPAPSGGQSKTGLTGSHPGAPTSTAEPALSAETIHDIRQRMKGQWIATGISPAACDALCDMALSSLTARDEVEKMRRRVEMYRDKARGNHEAYLKLYADFVGIEGASHD